MVKTTLLGATRLRNTTVGNARYELHTSDGNFRTKANSAVVDDLQNLLHRLGGQPTEVKLTLTARGTVWDIQTP